jgi:hypothetical protein
MPGSPTTIARGLSPHPKRDDFKVGSASPAPSLRANGSRQRAPDDRLREAMLDRDRASIGDFIAHDLGVSASRLLQRSSAISRSIELQTREISYGCRLKLYFAASGWTEMFSTT